MVGRTACHSVPSFGYDPELMRSTEMVPVAGGENSRPDPPAGGLSAAAVGTEAIRRCWCGADRLQPFSPAYGWCDGCGTLVSQKGLRPDECRVRDDGIDFYGKEY